MSRRRPKSRGASRRGLAPGTLKYAGAPSDAPIAVRVLSYQVDDVERPEVWGPDLVETARDPTCVTWVDVDGIHDADRVEAVAAPLGIHALWLEDVLNPVSRPKVETTPDQILAIVRMIRVVDDALVSEQVALLCAAGWVLSFQERPGDVWNPVRERIEAPGMRIRRMGSPYLLHALLDAVVDEYFVVVEHLDGRVDALEELALEKAPVDLPRRIHALRNEIVAFRAAVWPLREAASLLSRGEIPLIDEETRPFFRDLYDHVMQVVDRTESARDRLGGVLELYLAVTSHQLNLVMRVLTVVSTIFIPLTFIAGIYGMNFVTMPELQWRYGYPAVWAVMVGVAVALLVMFKRRGWL